MTRVAAPRSFSRASTTMRNLVNGIAGKTEPLVGAVRRAQLVRHGKKAAAGKVHRRTDWHIPSLPGALLQREHVPASLRPSPLPPPPPPPHRIAMSYGRNVQGPESRETCPFTCALHATKRTRRIRFGASTFRIISLRRFFES